MRPYHIKRIKIDKKAYHPKHIIAENSQIFNMLINLLTMSNEENNSFLNCVWKLLMKLPTNKSILEKI